MIKVRNRYTFTIHSGSRRATDEIAISIEYWCLQYANSMNRPIRRTLLCADTVVTPVTVGGRGKERRLEKKLLVQSLWD
jgi:hypothetical protein